MNKKPNDICIDISEHAIHQYINRFRPDVIVQVKNEIRQIASLGVRVKYQDEAVKLMNNGYKKSNYLKLADKVLVLSEDNNVKTVLDISGQQRKRWIVL